jgi:DNA-binding CsgD family transcriptional regulator
MEGPLTVDVTAAEFREDGKGAAFRACLTQRELSVLKNASEGRTADETASVLGLGMETVRSHLKKARTKLGARNSAHAVAEAMRQLLIA